MEFFNRFWELNIKSNPDAKTDFNYVIKQDDFGNSLRVNFDISATIDIRYYSGTIRIYNLEPDKRKNLVFNILGEKWGTGPSVKLVAGYQDNSGTILDGVVLRGYTIKEPTTGDWITVLQCGTSMKADNNITIKSDKITNGTLFALVKSWLSVIIPEGPQGSVDKNGRFIIKRSPLFDEKLKTALKDYTDKNTVNKKVQFSGPAAKILNEISSLFNIIFYYDNSGFSVTTNLLFPETESIVLSQETGMLGSPIYTDTGAKVRSYLRAEYKLFQPVRVKSDVLDKKVKITILSHTGDTHTNAWYSEIDTNNIGDVINA